MQLYTAMYEGEEQEKKKKEVEEKKSEQRREHTIMHDKLYRFNYVSVVVDIQWRGTFPFSSLVSLPACRLPERVTRRKATA